jgi:hypothetical protein
VPVILGLFSVATRQALGLAERIAIPPRIPHGDGGIGLVHLAGEPGDLSRQERLRVVAREHYHEHLGYTRLVNEGDDFPNLYCLWPDRQGSFRSDPRFPDTLRPLQPSLAPLIKGG